MTRRASLIAKITRPVFSGVCLRRRLFSRLDKGLKKSVVWISGPPGAGKTILASTYAETRKLSCIWYRADSGDSDPATFFYYLREAASKYARSRKKPLLPLFTPEYAHGVSVFSRRFFEELFIRAQRGPCLVIDNYQEVAPESLFHEAVKEGLSVLPEGVSAIIISRTGPPPAFAKLLASGSLAVIGPEELVLTPEESGCIMRLKLGTRALKKGSDEIIRMANGWAAGLAIMLEERSRGAGGLAEEVKGRLFDYFASEIFNRMDERERSLLVKTSVLSEFDAATAARIAGIEEAGAMLSALHKGNYFTERRLLARPVYQYHPLFREFLFEQLQKSYGPEALNQLRVRAASVLEELRHDEEAVKLLTASRDWDFLARILVRLAPELIGHGRHQALNQWLGSIPESKLKGDPWLLFWSGASSMPADPIRARMRLCAAYKLFKRLGDPAGLYLSWSVIADTFFFEWKDFRPLDGWIRELGRTRRIFPSYPSADIEERVVSSMFGALAFRQPENPEMPLWEERARDIIFKTGESASRILIGNNLVFYYLWTGRYAKARVVIDSLSNAFAARGPDLPFIMWCIVNALYNFHVSNCEEALAWVEKGLEASDSSGIKLLKAKLFGLGSFASMMSQTDIRTAEAYSRGMSRELSRENVFDLSYYHQQASRIALARGQMSTAIENIGIACDYAQRLGSPFLEGMAETIFSYYLVETGERSDAKRHLGHLRKLARDTGSALFEYILLMTEGLLSLNAGREEDCAESLRKALALGKRNGIRYLNINLPESSSRLLALALKSGIEPEFAGELIRSNALVCPDPELESWPWLLKVRTLGFFEVWKDEAKIEFARKAQQKPFDLLKALIVLGGKGVSERLITDILWPEADGDAAHSAFATTLHRLRQLIKCEKALELKDGKLTLDARYCWVDLWTLEAALKKAEGHLRSKCSEGLLRDAEMVLDLYTGEFLASDPDVPWTVQQRDKIKERVSKTILDASVCLISEKKAQIAAEYLSRGLAIDVCNEELCRKLIEIYVNLEKRRAALDTFERLRKAMAAKLGTEPSTATAALVKKILKNHSNP